MDGTQIIGTIAPMFGIMAFTFICWIGKLLLDRQKYAKQSEDHVLIMIIPKAGKFKNYLVPVESIGGVATIKIPDKRGGTSGTSPTHILGEDGEFLVDYPLGKIHFVQATVTGLLYYEGDSEPLSNISDRPIISGQLITNLIDGVGTATADAMKKSREESEGKLSKNTPTLWTLILGIVSLVASIAIIVLLIQRTEGIPELVTIVKQALGIAAGGK